MHLFSKRVWSLLQRITEGRGTMTMQFSRCDTVPPSVTCGSVPLPTARGSRLPCFPDGGGILQHEGSRGYAAACHFLCNSLRRMHTRAWIIPIVAALCVLL